MIKKFMLGNMLLLAFHLGLTLFYIVALGWVLESNLIIQTAFTLIFLAGYFWYGTKMKDKGGSLKTFLGSSSILIMGALIWIVEYQPYNWAKFVKIRQTGEYLYSLYYFNIWTLFEPLKDNLLSGRGLFWGSGSLFYLLIGTVPTLFVWIGYIIEKRLGDPNKRV